MSRTRDPIKALWKLDHTICMNANNQTIQFDIDKESDYPEGGYDPEDTDCKDVLEAIECIDIIEQALTERKLKEISKGDLVDKFNKFLDYTDVPTKIHLNDFKFKEAVREYRQLRTEIEDHLIVLQLVNKAPGELGFILSNKTYEDYIKTFTDIGGSADEAPYTEEEFNILKEYFGDEE